MNCRKDIWNTYINKWIIAISFCQHANKRVSLLLFATDALTYLDICITNMKTKIQNMYISTDTVEFIEQISCTNEVK